MLAVALCLLVVVVVCMIGFSCDDCTVVGSERLSVGLQQQRPQYVRGKFRGFTWETPPPDDCPVPRSTEFKALRFEGEYATYGNADTYYPSWSRMDGLMVSGFTDGEVQGVRSRSTCFHGSAAKSCSSTVGTCTILGEDPLNLSITNVKLYHSDTLPYTGRYPCGNLYFNRTWFYGTYYLLPGSDNCGSLCTLGPFSGFRWSHDLGRSWNEPRPGPSREYNYSIFEEHVEKDSMKVKYGAPHVVDFGSELEHSPDRKMYIIGHGASKAVSPLSWVQGSEIYLARVEPVVAAVNNVKKWEFWGGTKEGWVSGVRGVKAARPIFQWENRTGPTTMTYIHSIDRYIMAISTPSSGNSVLRDFDTYFLLARDVTGPFRLVTYLKNFGPQAYFVNIPSKFLQEKPNADGSLTFYLSYSANYAYKNNPKSNRQPNPPGSSYSWVLQQVTMLSFKSVEIGETSM